MRQGHGQWSGSIQPAQFVVFHLAMHRIEPLRTGYGAAAASDHTLRVAEGVIGNGGGSRSGSQGLDAVHGWGVDNKLGGLD